MPMQGHGRSAEGAQKAMEGHRKFEQPRLALAARLDRHAARDDGRHVTQSRPEHEQAEVDPRAAALVPARRHDKTRRVRVGTSRDEKGRGARTTAARARRGDAHCGPKKMFSVCASPWTSVNGFLKSSRTTACRRRRMTGRISLMNCAYSEAKWGTPSYFGCDEKQRGSALMPFLNMKTATVCTMH